jgi:hypothetical protein
MGSYAVILIVALISSTGGWLLMQCLLGRRHETPYLERVLLKPRSGRCGDMLADHCCTLDIGHYGVHDDGTATWYGSVQFSSTPLPTDFVGQICSALTVWDNAKELADNA